MESNYLDELNDSQREAVCYIDGPSLVIAGAGSGKTRVLTYKIAYLLEHGYAPWEILALTFTNKAAREMQSRIADRVGREQASRLWMGTFHSVFARILRVEADKIGFTSSYTIYDQTDSRNLVKSIIREMQLDDKQYKPNVISGHISNAKNRLVLPDAYLASAQTRDADVAQKIPMTGEIYRRYWLRCRQAGVMDFDDLLLNTYVLFKQHPDVCAKYATRFRYVLVDEYQDTNYAQHCIVWELTKGHQKVCVVGDDAQSIYSFRGANIDNILGFSKVYNNARLFKLEQNYRSTQTIVAAANSIIRCNSGQIRKDVFSRKEDGEPVHVYEAYSDLEEASIVVNKVAELNRRRGIAYNDMAVLYRTNAQSRTFEEALRKQIIPYRIYGGLSFYQRKEIKDVIAYFRLAVNPHDEEAFKRVINYPARGIGQTTLEKVTVAAADAGVSLWEVAVAPTTYNLSVNRGTAAKLLAFTSLIASFAEAVRQEDAHTLGRRIIKESGIMADLKQDTGPEGISRQENVDELLNGLQEFVAARREEGFVETVFLPNYLAEVSLLSDLDEDKGDDGSKLTLMTIHSAKGLEFRVVFIVGLEENLFPNQMTGGSMRELEEERRLFYVALTRAEELCYLSYARSRFRFGKTEFGEPSRFLKEIDPKCLRMEGGRNFSGISRSAQNDNRYGRSNASIWQADETETPANLTRIPSARLRTMPQTPSLAGPRITAGPSSLKPIRQAAVPTSSSGNQLTVTPGQTIEHERFGRGKVLSIDGSGENIKATVAFENTGTKHLLLRFARFKVVE